MKTKIATTSVRMNLPTHLVKLLDSQAEQNKTNRTALVTNILSAHLETPLMSNSEIQQSVIIAHANATNALNHQKLYLNNNCNKYLEDTIDALTKLRNLLK